MFALFIWQPKKAWLMKEMSRQLLEKSQTFSELLPLRTEQISP